MENLIINNLNKSISLKESILKDESFLNNIINASNLLINTYKSSNNVLIAGNGGSASDANHFSAEMVGRFYKERCALSCISLTTNTSILTSLSNDYSYDQVFSRELEAYSKKGDTFIGISTSGKSKNIINALNYAKYNGLNTISLVGEDTNLVNKVSDICISVPTSDTPRIQETHIFILHTFAQIVEKELF